MGEREKAEDYRERAYRHALAPQEGLVSFRVRYQQSDLWILADCRARDRSERLLLEARIQVEGYAGSLGGFVTSHLPLPMDPMAPSVVRDMLEAGWAAGVGPMAAVAGAIAQYVGEGLLGPCQEVMVENGGDLYLHAKRPITAGIFAGGSPLSRKLGVRVGPEKMPVGIATSSASVGHSWSYGTADAACVVADRAALADASATALCNRVRSTSDMEPALGSVLGVAGVRGALVILGESMAVQGDLELVALEP
jgi:hypothetical protein